MEETTTNAGKEAVPAKEVRIGRRQLLRALAVSSGVVAGSALVPGKWSKPLVEVGLLPAHAQFTPPPTMTSTPTATPTGTQTPTVTPTATPRCVLPDTPTQIAPDDGTTFDFIEAYFDIPFTWSTVTVSPPCTWVTYGIEIQFQNPQTSQWELKFEEDGLGSPTRTFQFIGPGSFRWRVWATTAAGDSPRSGWWYFQIGRQF